MYANTSLTQYGTTLSGDSSAILDYSTQIMVVRGFTPPMTEIINNMLLKTIDPSFRIVLNSCWTRYASLQPNGRYIHKHATEPVLVILSLPPLTDTQLLDIRYQLTLKTITTSRATIFKLGPLRLEAWPCLANIHGHPPHNSTQH